MPVNLYGPRDHFEMDGAHVIPMLIHKFSQARMRGEKRVVCWGDGTPTREFLYVTDAARAMVLAAEHYDGPEPVNLGSGEEVSIYDLAHRIAGLCGYQGDVVWDRSKPNGQPRRRLDTTRAEREFGFRAEIGLEEGLAATVNWYQAHGYPASPCLPEWERQVAAE
jgi:GDP-L-fucose synthase